MLDKIRFKKLWFVLFVLPLVFPPVNVSNGNGPYFAGWVVGPPIISTLISAATREYKFEGAYDDTEIMFGFLHYEFFVYLEHQRRDQYICWSRVSYWEAWMLTICFVVNRKRLMAKEVL